MSSVWGMTVGVVFAARAGGGVMLFGGGDAAGGAVEGAIDRLLL